MTLFDMERQPALKVCAVSLRRRGGRLPEAPSCGRLLPVEAFGLNPDGYDGRKVKCRLCESLWNMYRISYAECQAIIAGQEGKCPGCGTPVELGTGKLGAHVDHDHACGHPGSGSRCCRACVRGVLCAHCNVMAGWLEKYPGRIEPIRRYLHPESLEQLAARFELYRRFMLGKPLDGLTVA